MSFELSQELPENMQDILRSAVNVVNDDFDMGSFMQAFSKNTTRSTKPKNFTMLPNKVSVDRTESSFHQDNLRSCPIMHDPIFNFDEGSIGPKDNYYQNIQKQGHDQNDKLKNLMNENNIRKAITDMVNQNGGNLDLPTLKVQVTGNPNYEIEESDILNLFSRYGKVVNISLAKHRTAYIVFSEIISALYAQKSLNNQYVRQFDIKLYVSWSNGEEELLRVEPEPRQPLINQNSKGVYQNYNLQNLPLSTSKSLPNLDSIPTFSYNPVKFTCKYEIQIDNDKDFKIARKIIGPKGCNMKKIIELCKIQVNRRDLNMQSDFLKLRLRGKGSGFKEGSEQKESDDPLHLCVSSKYQEVYNIACKYVEDLIGSLYKEYEAFCQMADRPLSEPVQIKKIEISNGIEKKFSEEYKSFNQNLTRKSSIEYNMMQNMKSLNVSGNSNSPHESPNNSLTALSDKDNANSPNSRNNTSHPDTTRSP